jgi:hypothetical protein
MTIRIDGDAVVARVNSDPEFDISARDWTCIVRLDMETQSWDAHVCEGKLLSFTPATDRTPDVVFSGPESIWNELFKVVQKPLHIGLPFLAKRMGLLTETGEWIRHNAPYGFALQLLFEAIRHQGIGA